MGRGTLQGLIAGYSTQVGNYTGNFRGMPHPGTGCGGGGYFTHMCSAGISHTNLRYAENNCLTGNDTLPSFLYGRRALEWSHACIDFGLWPGARPICSLTITLHPGLSLRMYRISYLESTIGIPIGVFWIMVIISLYMSSTRVIKRKISGSSEPGCSSREEPVALIYTEFNSS